MQQNLVIWGDKAFLTSFSAYFNQGELPQHTNPRFIRHYCVTQFQPSTSLSLTRDVDFDDDFPPHDVNSGSLYVPLDQSSSIIENSRLSELAPEFDHPALIHCLQQLSGICSTSSPNPTNYCLDNALILPKFAEFDVDPISPQPQPSPSILLSPLLNIPNTDHNRSLAAAAKARTQKSTHDPLTLRADTRLHSIELPPLDFTHNQPPRSEFDNSTNPDPPGYNSNSSPTSSNPSTAPQQTISQFVLPMVHFHFATNPHLALETLPGYLSQLFFIDLSDELLFIHGLNAIRTFAKHHLNARSFVEHQLSTRSQRIDFRNRSTNVMVVLYGADVVKEELEPTTQTDLRQNSILKSVPPVIAQRQFSHDPTVSARYASFEEVIQSVYALHQSAPLSVQIFPIPLSNCANLITPGEETRSTSSLNSNESQLHNDESQFRTLLELLYAEIIRSDLKYSHPDSTGNKRGCTLM